MPRATMDCLEELHRLVGDVLLEHLKADRGGRLVVFVDGEWVHVRLSAASYNQALKFLSDNGVVTPDPGTRSADPLKVGMPNFDDDTIVPFTRRDDK